MPQIPTFPADSIKLGESAPEIAIPQINRRCACSLFGSTAMSAGSKFFKLALICERSSPTTNKFFKSIALRASMSTRTGQREKFLQCPSIPLPSKKYLSSSGSRMIPLNAPPPAPPTTKITGITKKTTLSCELSSQLLSNVSILLRTSLPTL